MNLSAIILAAGEGSRMKSNLPKVMHKVAGKPLIWHVLHQLAKTIIEEQVVVIGENVKILTDYLHVEFGATRQAVQKEKLGTAHAVLSGLNKIHNKNNNVIILYGDTPFVRAETMERMNSLIDPQVALVTLGFIAKDPAKYGRFVLNKNDELEKIVEYLDASEKEREINLCNSGVLVINSSYLHLLREINNKNAKNEYYLTDLIQIAKQHNLKVKYLTVDETEVLGINNRSELAYAEEICQTLLRKNLLEAGVTLIDPKSVILSADTIIQQDCIIHPHVVFGPGVSVGSNVEIKSFSHIEGTEIKCGAVIGPFARIRPRSILGEDVRVGNFVEIKNSNIAQGTKINHLSYVGDSELGKNVNIGAGTITCNYDGYNKFKTNIEDEVFVGSNTSLIAPLQIGKGSIIAAGSVITKDVKQNTLAITRGEEKSYLGKAEVIRNKAKTQSIQFCNNSKKL